MNEYPKTLADALAMFHKNLLVMLTGTKQSLLHVETKKSHLLLGWSCMM